MRMFMCTLLLVGWCGSLSAQDGQVRFGFVTDGPSPSFDENYLSPLKKEIETLLRRDYRVSFAEPLVSAFDKESIRANLDALLADDSVDMVLCMGVLSTLEAASRGPFEKPVFAPFGIDPTLPSYPRQAGASGVHNFSYLVTPSSVSRDAALIARLKPLKKVHMVVIDAFAELIPNVQEYVRASFAKHNIEVVFVQAHNRADEVLAKIPNDAEMVYITPLLRFNQAEKLTLFQGLAQRRIPSFSLLGQEDVEAGVMAGLAPKSERLRWLRRVALNIQRTLLGEDPSTYSILLKENSELVINMETARTVNWYPSWDIQIGARLINEERKDIQRNYDLGQAVRRAIEANPQYQARIQELDAARVRVDEVRANRRPQLEADVTGVAIDEDTAAASFGSQPETRVTGELTLSQLLYSDKVNAGVTIRELSVQADAFGLEAARLDLALDASERYLNFLKARTLYRVRRENLDLTVSNLETARIRREIGIAGPSEVLRWDSQLATDKLEAIRARNQADQALYSLNQVLHEPQEFMLRAKVPDINNPNMRTGFGRLQGYVNNTRDFERFRYFMVEEALREAPELARIDVLQKLTRRQIEADRRAFYLPTVSVQANFTHEFHRDSGGDSPLVALLPPGSSLPQVPEDGWNAAINFNLPLFTGGARKAALSADSHSAQQLELQRKAVEEQIELRIRAGLQEVATTAVGIQLRQDAANAAAKNLELVEDAYATGVASLIDLLDAQNAALVAQEAAANANFDYFLAIMRFQRASGNFDFFLTSADRDAFFLRLEQFYKEHR